MFLVNRVPWRTVRAIVPFTVLAFHPAGRGYRL